MHASAHAGARIVDAMQRALVTGRLFAAYLACPTKCYLQSIGEIALGSAYTAWAME